MDRETPAYVVVEGGTAAGSNSREERSWAMLALAMWERMRWDVPLLAAGLKQPPGHKLQ